MQKGFKRWIVGLVACALSDEDMNQLVIILTVYLTVLFNPTSSAPEWSSTITAVFNILSR